MIKRWALFLSGRGSTAQALLDMIGDHDIRLVVTNKKSAFGIKRARRLGVPVLFYTKSMMEEGLTQELRDRGITHIFLVGYMKILGAAFVDSWKGKIFNIHPSLLPAFPGAGALELSYEASSAQMGVTVHEVTAEMDAGPILAQRKVTRGFDFQETRNQMARAEQQLLRRCLDYIERKF